MRRYTLRWLFATALIFSCSPKPASVPPSPIGYGDDGMITKQGRRVFIIGSYYLPQGDDGFRQAVSCGYNLVRVGEKRNELDQAQAHGLDAWISIGSIHPSQFDSGRAAYDERINRLKDHPALLFWEMEDEPAWRWNSAEARIPAEDLQKSYAVLKENDPHHLVYTNHAPTNLISTLQRYNEATDIVACDIYPIIPPGIRITYALFPDGMQGDLLNTYPSQVGDYTDKMRTVAGSGRPVFMVLQGFSWEMLRQPADRDTQMIRYPTYHESRFMAYQAIVHGANGIIYWGSAYTPQPSPFWSDLQTVTKELAAMQPVLASRTVRLPLTKDYVELGHSVDRGVEMMVKSVDGVTYLLTVNADKNPLHLRLGGLNDYSRAHVLTEEKELPIEQGVLQVLYEPFATKIFKLEKLTEERRKS